MFQVFWLKPWFMWFKLKYGCCPIQSLHTQFCHNQIIGCIFGRKLVAMSAVKLKKQQPRRRSKFLWDPDTSNLANSGQLGSKSADFGSSYLVYFTRRFCFYLFSQSRLNISPTKVFSNCVSVSYVVYYIVTHGCAKQDLTTRSESNNV